MWFGPGMVARSLHYIHYMRKDSDRHDSAYPSGQHYFFQVAIKTHSFLVTMSARASDTRATRKPCGRAQEAVPQTRPVRAPDTQATRATRNGDWQNATHY